jgi:uncharacterized protein
VNRLAGSASPYLRQHQDNPVDWYPWGDEAFAAAKERDRPILLSIGYSSCHWCHVMAHESFEDDAIAARMNELFVNVKVDREERPDIDAIYMETVQRLTGRGGWPMTVFLLPDGRPFHGGMYFRPDQFQQLMDAVDAAWADKRGDLTTQAAQLTKALRDSATVTAGQGVPSIDLLNAALGTIGASFDREWGGFGSAPKFPQTALLELVLRAWAANGGDGAKEVLTTTLDAMASGGMYDHLAGGFCRYSTDREWKVPHFEKMLYDQALLAGLYLHAWQGFGHARWIQVAAETIEYVLAWLRGEHGGFFSAEDADSMTASGELTEGAFATWTPAEVRAALDGLVTAATETVEARPLADVAIDWYGMTEDGDLDGRAVLHVPVRGQIVRTADVERARRAMLVARVQRPRPQRDDKVICEWNALFLRTLAEAALVTGNPRWREAAIANAELLAGDMRDGDGRWLRTLGGTQRAFAADLAALVSAFIAVASCTGDGTWIDVAVDAADQLLDEHWDPDEGGVFTVAGDAETLIVRQKDLIDDATPSANSLAADALLRLAAITGESRYANHADRILTLVGPVAERQPTSFTHLLGVIATRHRGTVEIVIPGSERTDLVALAARPYFPERIVVWGRDWEGAVMEGRSEGSAYVCRGSVCGLPATTQEELLEQMRRPG